MQSSSAEELRLEGSARARVSFKKGESSVKLRNFSPLDLEIIFENDGKGLRYKTFTNDKDFIQVNREFKGEVSITYSSEWKISPEALKLGFVPVIFHLPKGTGAGHEIVMIYIHDSALPRFGKHFTDC